ncbi:MAG: hypothetical protein WC554_02960 [Clostridia bacterium]|jgi:hypothetical protein
MATLEDKQIETDLKDIESVMKNKKTLTREDIQKALDKIHGKKYSPEKKKEILKNLVIRTNVKVKGIQNYFSGSEELAIVDKTFNFLNDLESYNGFMEKDK